MPRDTLGWIAIALTQMSGRTSRASRSESREKLLIGKSSTGGLIIISHCTDSALRLLNIQRPAKLYKSSKDLSDLRWVQPAAASQTISRKIREG